MSGKQAPGDYHVPVIFRESAKGKPFSGSSLILSVMSPGVVKAISVNLKRDPAYASTKEDFDATMIFERLGGLFPASGCPERDRQALYRFFFEQVKPVIQGPRRNTYSGVGSATDQYEYTSKRVLICGSYFEYHREKGVSTEYISSDNISGEFDDIEINLFTVPSGI